MDITPIYELRNRLRAAMIAGTDLLPEDFRLKKAVEGFKPLSSVSPIFGKINELLTKLSNDKSPEILLDTITFVDAVITTLATINIDGELEDISAEDNFVTVNAPYSRLSLVINALTKSGSGNCETVSKAWQETPELFRDYRIKPALVKGLGASYNVLADYVIDIITGIGKEMLPFLKKGFDPKGKTDMVRRMICIDNLCGAEESAFLLDKLESSKKDVRKMLIYALRHDENNVKTLIELCKTEKKGICRDAAIYALGEMNCEKAEEYYYELAKHPVQLLPYMERASADWAGKLTAKLIDDVLYDKQGNKITLSLLHAEPKIETKEPVYFQTIMNAIKGKRGTEIEQFFRDFRLKITNTPLDRDMDECLTKSILITGDESLINLAIELNNNGETKELYPYAECVARLMKREDQSEWYCKAIDRCVSKYGGDDKKIRDSPEKSALFWLYCMNGAYVMHREWYDNFTGAHRIEEKNVTISVKKIIDSMIKYDIPSFTSKTYNLYDPNDEQLREKLVKHYIHVMTETRDSDIYTTFYRIQHMGHNDPKELEEIAAGWCRKHPDADKYALRNLIRELPTEAARNILDRIKSKELKVKADDNAIDMLYNFINER